MPKPDDKLFVCISEMRKPEALMAHMPAHKDWLREQDRHGRVVATGARLPLGAGGVQIFAAADRDEMEAILASDPLVEHGVAANWIFEFQLNDRPDRGRLMEHFFGAEFAAGLGS